jgi:hypothetical protein
VGALLPFRKVYIKFLRELSKKKETPIARGLSRIFTNLKTNFETLEVPSFTQPLQIHLL